VHNRQYVFDASCYINNHRFSPTNLQISKFNEMEEGLTSPPSDIPTFVIDTSRATCTREVIAIDILRITCNGPMPTTWDFAGEASDLRCTGLAAIPNSVFACNMRFVNGFGIGGPDLPCFIGQQEITCLKPF
jgi:hypothetical protein